MTKETTTSAEKMLFLPMNEKTIKTLLSKKTKAMFTCGELVRLYFGLPVDGSLDGIPYVTTIIAGTTTSVRNVHYRLAFYIDDSWVTCNRYYGERYITRTDGLEVVDQDRDLKTFIKNHPEHVKWKKMLDNI